MGTVDAFQKKKKKIPLEQTKNRLAFYVEEVNKLKTDSLEKI